MSGMYFMNSLCICVCKLLLMDRLIFVSSLYANLFLSVIRAMICLERALDEALDSLKARLAELRPDTDLAEDIADDLESIASSTMNPVAAPHRMARAVRFGGASAEVERLQKKLSKVEQENQTLRKEIRDLKILMTGQKVDDDEEEKSEGKQTPKTNILSEGGVLKIIRGSLSLS
jgi:prefoldin subunit 5